MSEIPGAVSGSPDGAAGITTADGLVVLETVQEEGRRAVSISEFIRGHDDFIGSKFD